VTTLAGLGGGPGHADGIGRSAQFCFPRSAAVDSAGNIFTADSDCATIRKVTPTGAVTTLAGLAGNPGAEDGNGSAARFNNPSGLVLDTAETLYVADRNNQTIRKVAQDGTVTTLAGLAGIVGALDGPGTNALFNAPTSVAVDAAGDVFVTDSLNATIRRISL